MRPGQQLRQVAAGLVLFFDDLDPHTGAHEPGGQVVGDATAAQDGDCLDAGRFDAQVAQQHGHILRLGGDVDVVAGSHHKVAGGDDHLVAAGDGADEYLGPRLFIQL